MQCDRLTIIENAETIKYFFLHNLLTGWGLTNGAGILLPNSLQWIQIPIHSAEFCANSIFSDYMTENMVCVGERGHATCNVSSFLFNCGWVLGLIFD